MTLRCLRLPLLGVALLVTLFLFGASPALAVGENPTIDGDLTDLIAAVNANLGSDQGGFAFTDPPSDVFTGTCAYINGYDIVKSYAFFRLKDASGAYVPNNVTLYLGWEVTGVIGDVDGDGNADTYDPGGPGSGCALSDGGGNSGCASGIGAGESYSILLNLNCQGVDELRLGVSNNKVAALTAGGDVIKQISGAFCRTGHFLEMRIDHYEALIKDPTLVSPAIGADLCKANLRMVSNAGDDLLAEDTTPTQQLRVPSSVKITKTPASQDACPGTNVSWAIQVCNDGICPFSTMTVRDTLDAGLTYVSDDKGSVQGATPQIRVFTFSNVNPGDCVTINLTAKVDFPCAAEVLHNNVGVEAVHPLGPCSELADNPTAHASALVNCTQPSVDIQKSISPKTLNPGQKATVTLTITNDGNSPLNPINVCDKLDAGVGFDAAQSIGGSCGVTLLSNTLNGDGTRTICFSPFSLAKGGSCTITYQVGCVTVGDHPDTATVTAFCTGNSQDAVTDKAFDSFHCACPPDVEIGKQVNPPTIVPGQDVTVTLTISNPGQTTLDPINVCDKLSAGVDFDAAQVIGGTCAATLSSNTLNADGTRTICFTPFSLAAGASCTITYKVKCAKPGVHPDTATVVAQCKDGSEQDKDQDQAAGSFTCLCPPDVEIGKSVNPPTVNPGGEVTVTLTISNPGQTVLDPINVCDKLDAGVDFDASQAIGGTCGVTLSSNTLNGDGTRTICFSPFSLPVDGSCTITYKVKCAKPGAHPDTATVVAQCKDGGEQDKDQDRAAATFTCACPPDVELSKSVTGGALPGQDATVTLTISNPGQTTLDPINVCDKLDAGVSFDAAQAIGGTCGVSLSSNTLNGDGTRTICFSPFSLAAGTSCTITYKVKCVLPGVHPDTATVVAQCKDGGEQDKDQDQAASSFTCACPADVEIGKQVNPPTILPGQDVTVTLTISNPGQTVLDPIHVCDKLSAGVDFDAAQVIGGTCSVTLASNTLNADGTRSICFTPFSLDPSSSCTITYKVKCAKPGVHPDTATVVAQCKNGSEQDKDQDHAAGSFTCLCPPDVEIGKSVTGGAQPGQDATVTLTISNPGQTVLDPVNVCDKLDAGVSFDAAQVIGGTCGVTLSSNTLNGDGTRTICFTPFSLPVGGSCTITYKVKCVTSGIHPDTATVVAQCKDGGEQDKDQDQAASSFNCACPADVEIGKSVNPPSVTPGGEVTITLNISNLGTTVLDPINVCDKLDAGVSFDATQTIGGTCGVTLASNTLNGDGSRSLCFTPFSLNPGASCTITYKVKCVNPGSHPDTATVVARCKDGGEQDRDEDRAQSSFNCACPADVEIGKSVNPPNVTPGQDVTVTLTISNPGSTVLDPINVCDKLDAGVSFDAAQTIGGTCGVTLASNTLNGDGTRSLCFTPFSLNPGASCTITYKVRCVTSGSHPDTATVVAQCKGGGESDRDQDQAHSSFNCACVPDVRIGKSVSPGEIKQNEFVTVTLTISNPGSTVLDPINVCDKLDAGVGFDPSQAIGGSCGVTLASNTENGDGSRILCFTPFSLNPGQSCTISYQVSCLQDGVHPDTATVTAKCKNGSESDVDHDRAVASFTCNSQACCWLTMGGFLNANTRSGHKDNTYGGNVGPPPSGSWQHIQRNGKTEVFNFHSHDAHVIECGNDGNAGPCHPKGDANFIVFGGTGAYSLNGGSREFPATFIARAEDHGEPGRQGTQKGGCGTPDYYTITVFNKDTGEQVFTAAGYVDGGNVQIHDCKHSSQTSAPTRGAGKNGLGGLSSDGADASTVGTDASGTAQPLELYRPVPNPFQNTTTIAYAVGGNGQAVEIGIYDVAGRLIRNLASGFQSAGRYQVVWDGKNAEGTTVSHGVYFLRAFVGGERVAAAASRILYLR